MPFKENQVCSFKWTCSDFVQMFMFVQLTSGNFKEILSPLSMHWNDNSVISKSSPRRNSGLLTETKFIFETDYKIQLFKSFQCFKVSRNNLEIKALARALNMKLNENIRQNVWSIFIACCWTLRNMSRSLMLLTSVLFCSRSKTVVCIFFPVVFLTVPCLVSLI